MSDKGTKSRARRSVRVHSESDRPELGRNVNRLLVLFVALLLWNSLIPFELRLDPQRFSGQTRVLGLPLPGSSYPDVMSNILLYIPLGALLSLRYWFRSRSLLIGLALAFLGGTGLSYGVEFLQQFSSERIPSAGDWACNVLGTVVGGIFAPLLYALSRTLRRRWQEELQAHPLVSMTKLYAAVLLLVALAPWSFTADGREIAARFRSAQVHPAAMVRDLVPQPLYSDMATYEAHAMRRRQVMEQSMTGLYELITFAVLGALVARILECNLGFGRAWRFLLTLWLVLGWATIAGGLQLTVRFGTGDFLAYFCRLLGGAIGVVMSGRVPVAWTKRDVIIGWAESGFAVRNRTRFPLVPSAIFVILFMSWVPFIYSTSGEHTLAIHSPTLFPFLNYYHAKFPIAVQDMIFKLLRFGALGLVFSLMSGPRTGRKLLGRVVTTATICALVALLVEVVQVVIPTRRPDVTDLLLGFMGGAFGVLFHAWLLHYLRSLGKASVSKARRSRSLRGWAFMPKNCPQGQSA